MGRMRTVCTSCKRSSGRSALKGLTLKIPKKAKPARRRTLRVPHPAVWQHSSLQQIRQQMMHALLLYLHPLGDLSGVILRSQLPLA